MTKTTITLDDKYLQTDGRVFMSAIQALVRLPLDQARRDKANGLSTAGFISGYRGSPLGTYDAALWSAQKFLAEADVTFLPALNEELAASSVRGTQELDWLGKSNFDGIFALWYGKGVGTDRAMEALKLGNLEGTANNGGVLVLTGDDHGGKSSASAHQSDHTLIAAMIPILYPSSSAEIIEFGLAGWAMSRFSGSYVSLKCVTDTLDYSSSVTLPDALRNFNRPDDVAIPNGGLGLQQLRSPLQQEDYALRLRLPAVQAFARANGLDRVIFDSGKRSLGIVAAGKAYLDTRQALHDLGLSEMECARLGIRLYKPGLVWPIEPERASEFAKGHHELLVVEEKRPVIEDQLASLLYAMLDSQRPVLTGKKDHLGKRLLSAVGELSPSLVRDALINRLETLNLTTPAIANKIAFYKQSKIVSLNLTGSGVVRPPYYCSGCPHNTSTKLPDGSIAISAVGCHGLAAFMPERRTLMPMPMGGDGMPWVAAGPFVDTQHIFQNMGDGTYAHSGILSIRAAVAAGSTMTFKILYNDAVAMTGGQPVEGAPTPLDIVRQLLAERVSPVVIVSDEPEDFRGANAPPSEVNVHHRDELNHVQEHLRIVKGVSAIVYVQTCAAEKRRRRKRGTFPDPDKRIFINPAVCEGCGDCSVQSNCLSIQPLETAFGRKRTIDQSSCNKDYSCIKGFCPSFVTIEGGALAQRNKEVDPVLMAEIQALPEPEAAIVDGVYNTLITGIGGTGVLTIGAVLGMAAHLDGLGCTVMDQTGMAQKGGAVTSHLRVGPSQEHLHSARLDVGMTDLIIACDMVVASSAAVLATAKRGEAHAVLNTNIVPTGAFQTNRDFDLDKAKLQAIIEAGLEGGKAHHIPATDVAISLVGDSIAANFLMVGFSVQKGLLPVSLASLEEAIRLNRTNVEQNLYVLGLGRLLAHHPDAINSRVSFAPIFEDIETLDGLVENRRAFLKEYQNAAYSKQFVDFVEEITRVVSMQQVAGAEIFVHAAANGLAKLMAYKDEYEVARLHSNSVFEAERRKQFTGSYSMKFHLAPPLLSRVDPATGRPRKIAFGSWVMPFLRLLAKMRRLRGTWLDPFGYSHERREERTLVNHYRSLIKQTATALTDSNLDASVALATAILQVKGFGPVKSRAIADYYERLPALMSACDRKANAMPEKVDV